MNAARRSLPASARPVARSACLALIAVLLAGGTNAATLKGSPESVDLQNRVARRHGFSYLATPADVREFVENGTLVSIPGNRDYELADVSFPYGRPELKIFIERLAAQYRKATGEKLVVTSLTRPRTRQPRNASSESVHPTGMAADIRRSADRRAQQWLERTLLALENAGVLDATRERRPPHYHVALFPDRYLAHVGAQAPGETELASAEHAPPREPAVAATRSAARSIRVAHGDSLWGIAKRHGTSVETIRRLNRLGSSRIFPGQVLKVPAH